MIDFNAIIKLINSNNDQIIQKDEVEAYLKKNKSPSIFTGYLSSFDKEEDINIFKNKLIEISQQNGAQAPQIATPKTDEAQSSQIETPQEDEPTSNPKNTPQRNGLYAQAYQCIGYKFKSDDDFKAAFDKAFDKVFNNAQTQTNSNDIFWEEIMGAIPEIDHTVLMERINTGQFSYIGNDFQDITFDDVDLSKYPEAFRHISFNERTFAKISPEHLPEGFKPKEIFEKGKTIGLGIDKTHKMGYNGSGVSFAIIDSGVEPHQDIKFKEYNVAESAQNVSWLNHFHGSAVSYIAQEIAPEADCYYYATYNGGNMDKPVLENLKAILEKNKSLPEPQKIRFISMSMPLYGGEEAKQVVAELESQGVWVYYSGCPEDEKIGYLEKINPNGDPNDFDNYQISAGRAGNLYVNSGDRTVPDPSGPDAYRHDCPASQSWSTPVIAGYYTLACQADPSMTKERFMKLAEQTAQTKLSTEPNWIRIGEDENCENSWIKQGRSTDPVEIKIIDINALLQAIEAEKNNKHQ